MMPYGVSRNARRGEVVVWWSQCTVAAFVLAIPYHVAPLACHMMIRTMFIQVLFFFVLKNPGTELELRVCTAAVPLLQL